MATRDIFPATTNMLREFFKLQSAGGAVLAAGAALALAAANVPALAPWYRALLEVPIEIRLGALHLDKNLLLVVNDGLMAVFFLLVGLEIKREVREGELRTRSQIVLPAIAAFGGVLLPALIYSGINHGSGTALQGWAIPAATDIAFSLGVLSLMGTRVPVALKVFLTAVAVVDDLAAIVIIAVFYTAKLSVAALALAAVGAVGMFVLNRAGVMRRAPYVLLGIFMWVCTLKSGVHATLAGVAMAFAIPMVGRRDEPSPLREMEHALHPWVAYGILPLFAFANSGVSFAGISAEVFLGRITLGIVAGLVVGKLGVFVFAAAAILLRIGRLPAGATWGSFFGVSALTGIGFTMSLFIGTLAFEGLGPEYAAATRVGVFSASIIAALVGSAILSATLPRPGPARAEGS